MNTNLKFLGFITFVFLVGTLSTQAQSSAMEKVDSLLHLTIFDSIELEERESYFNQAQEVAFKFLESKGSFKRDLSHLNWVSTLYPADSSFRILTAQLNHRFTEYKYWGLVQLNDGTVVNLTDDPTAYEEGFDFDVFDESAWYGGLYYNVVQTDSEEGRKYLIFGFRGLGPYKSRKFIDVLTIKGSSLAFGAPLFRKGDQGDLNTLYRWRLDYAPKAVVSLNFDHKTNQIFFNHLVTVNSGHPKAGMVNVPDGVFELLKHEHNIWKHYDTPVDLLSSDLNNDKKFSKDLTKEGVTPKVKKLKK